MNALQLVFSRAVWFCDFVALRKLVNWGAGSVNETYMYTRIVDVMQCQIATVMLSEVQMWCH
jgi:hypothetical protein